MQNDQPASLAQQRLSLRRQLALQREQIAARLAVPPTDPVNCAFPRSTVMQLITMNSSTAAKIGASLARFLLGERIGEQLCQALLLVKIGRHLWRP